jgi:hypothetical protein
MGNETLMLELYSTQLSNIDVSSLDKIKVGYTHLPDHDLGSHWYDHLKMSPTLAKRGKKLKADYQKLCEEFFRTKQYRKKPLFWVLSFLVFNFLTRPDFIAYNHAHAHNISRRICKKMGALSGAYTIKSHKEYEKAKERFDLFIFDSFRL